jgi:hypothetical protein
VRAEVPYDPQRHGGILPAEPLPEPESAGTWDQVEHLLPRLVDVDQDIVEMLRWGVSRPAIEHVLDVTEAAMSMRIFTIHRRIQHLLTEPPWDREGLMSDIARLHGAERHPGVAAAWADWIWGPRSAAWYGRLHGMHQHYTCASWIGHPDTTKSSSRKYRYHAARWDGLSDMTREAILWRRAAPSNFDIPMDRGIRWTPSLTAAVRDVLAGGLVSAAARTHGISRATVERAAHRRRWTNQHKPVWVILDDPHRPPPGRVYRHAPRP